MSILRAHSGQLPVGLIAELVEHCNGIAVIMACVRIPFRLEFYFQALISQLLIAYSCDVLCGHIFLCRSNMRSFSYSITLKQVSGCLKKLYYKLCSSLQLYLVEFFFGINPARSHSTRDSVVIYFRVLQTLLWESNVVVGSQG